MSIYVGTSEIKNIVMGPNPTSMQGPCSTGFHVPTKDENVALVAAMTALGIDTSNGNCMKTYLKMPFAGYRYSSSAGVYSQGTTAYYWSSTAYSADIAYNLTFKSAGLYPQYGDYRSDGFSVRCFKNSPLQPTSSWTTLFDGSGIAAGAGIFHNTTDGVISISSDGTNWITIADKNLGATTVYNDGDTLSQANCGNYYQRGNNYGFPRTGSVTTSSTQVDASNYGPGNYYNSSTFITRSSSPYDWSSVQNDNLRGGQYTPVKEVYVGSTKVRPAGWQPGANTIAYYKFEDDRNDYSGNNYNVTNANNTQLTTFNGVKCLKLNSSYCSVNTINTLTTTNNYTMLGWFYLTGNLAVEYSDGGLSWGGSGFSLRYNNGDRYELRWGNTTNKNNDENNWNIPTGQWFMFAVVADNGKGGFYKNTTYTQLRSSGVVAPNHNGTPLYIGASYEGTVRGNGYVSNLIIEDKARTAQEITDYYNQTKGNYGL